MIKKLLVVFSCCIISITNVIGQEKAINNQDTVGLETSKKVWEFGLMGGLIFSTVEGDNTETHTYIAGLGAGGYATMEIFYPLGLMIELYYAGMGTGFASLSDTKLRFNYLVLPILFDYEFRPGISLGLGPYFGFLLNAKDTVDDFEEDITDLIAGLDVGVKIGFYFDVSETINLAMTFNRGFINTQSGDRVSTLKQYNQCIMFSTGVNLNALLNK